MTTAGELADALRARGKRVEKYGNGFMAQCPAHDDGRPSLKIDMDGERLLAHCFAGCSFHDVIKAAGVEATPGDPLLAHEARMKLRQSVEPAADTDTYEYRDEFGDRVFRVVRKSGKRFMQEHYAQGQWLPGRNGTAPIPFMLPELIDGVKAGRTIYVTEGEKDALAIVAAGGVATCNPGGAKKWDPLDTWGDYFAGASVVIVPDQDEPGTQHAEQVKQKLEAVVGTLEVKTPKVGKDAYDHLSAGYTLDELVGEKKEKNVLEDFTFEFIDPDAPPPPPPTVMPIGDRAGGVLGHLFSRGGKYLLTGPQASGKTFLSLALATTMIQFGEKVLWADPDGSGQGRIGARLHEQFGVPKSMMSDNFMYARASLAYTHELELYREHMRAQVERYMPSLVVWDSWGPALAALGLDGTTSDSDINAWWQTFVEPVVDVNPQAIVVVLDHVPKNDSENSIKGVYGNQRKLSAPDYALTMKQAGTTAGAFYVDILKDRDNVWESWGPLGLQFQIVGDGTWTLLPNASEEERISRKEHDRSIGLLTVLKKANDAGVFPTKNKWWNAYKTDREDKGYEVGRKADVLGLISRLSSGGFAVVNGGEDGSPTYKWDKPYDAVNVSRVDSL
jgi:hypothetical protein